MAIVGDGLIGSCSLRSLRGMATRSRRSIVGICRGFWRFWWARRDAEVSADLAAEVFSAVLLAAERYEPQSDTAAPWLVGIARNTLGASRRRGRVEHRARLRLGFAPLKVDDADLARTLSLADRGQGGLSDVLASLPRDQRDAVEARVLDERSYSDIARELSCSELVVGKRVSRGLARLRANRRRSDDARLLRSSRGAAGDAHRARCPPRRRRFSRRRTRPGVAESSTSSSPWRL